jgi:hypothetical protein
VPILSNQPRDEAGDPAPVSADLVEYLIVTVPDIASLDLLAPPLAELVRGKAIRILDLVVVEKNDDGAVSALELGDVEAMAALHEVAGPAGGMLSEHDVRMAATALRPGSVGLVVVTEDRWAEPLSAAAQRVGGQIIAGDRIPATRVESVIAARRDDEEEGGR